MKHHSRNENQKILTKEEIMKELKLWKEMDEIESYSEEEEEDSYVWYEATDSFGCDYVRTLYPQDQETKDSLMERIHVDDKTKEFIDVKGLSKFLYENGNADALMVLEGIVLFWEQEETISSIREKLWDSYGDEYFMEACDGDCVGYTWVERGIVFVNVGKILDLMAEDYELNGSFPLGNDFTQEFKVNFLGTLCHELRHLVYECNEFGDLFEKDREFYPNDGGLEENVEEWGNDEAESFLSDPNVKDSIDGIFQEENLRKLGEELPFEEEKENE